MDFYVYYKVGPAAAEELAQKITSLQQQLAAEHGVTTALKRRPGEQDGLQTWMEVYSGAPAGFGAVLARAVMNNGLEVLVEGARHTEIFVDLKACA